MHMVRFVTGTLRGNMDEVQLREQVRSHVKHGNERVWALQLALKVHDTF